MAGDKGLDRRFAFFRFLLAPAISKFFGYRYDALAEVEGPYFLLSNHNTDLDPVFLGIAAGTGVRFVASEHIAHKGFISRLLLKMFRPILHTKGKAGIGSAREILETLRGGTSVGLFPEGNRSFYGKTLPIPAVTGKLARRTGVKLVTWRIEGGYMTQPRWGKGIRRGRINGKLVGVYEPETLKAMTDGEVQKLIEHDLYEDAFETQARLNASYRSKAPAEGLESALYLCPACGKIGCMTGRENTLTCSCGHEWTLTDRMLLRDGEGKEITVDAAAEAQRQALRERVERERDSCLFSDDVKISRISDHQVKSITVDRLEAYSDHFAFAGKSYAASDISGVAIVGRNTLVVHLNDESEHLEIRGEIFYSAVKYENLYQIMKERAGE